MKSRGLGGILWREPERTKAAEPHAPPPVVAKHDEIRRWGLCRAFVQVFKSMTTRIKSKARLYVARQQDPATASDAATISCFCPRRSARKRDFLVRLQI
jgi:hypothetical protein